MKIEKILVNNCEILRPEPFGFIIFGASGNLTYNKLIPSLFGLFKKGIIKNNFFIIGVGRTTYDDSSFRVRVENSIKNRFKDLRDKIIEDFCANTYYIKGKYEDIYTYNEIKERINELSLCYKTKGNIIYNVATPPILFEPIVIKLVESGLLGKNVNKNFFQRIMIEKPFGYDLKSAKKLNNIILKKIDDEQVFRIDHYLGKSTVQNILVFRFANTIFYDLWNNKNIECIQIKFKETSGVEERIEYFDSTGLIRDVFQNHILQLISLVTMEHPKRFTANYIQKEKNNIFKNIKPFNGLKLKEQIILGQYDGYRQYKKGLEKSCTETFFATRLFINNKRWNNVPVYIIAGKKMDCDESSIKVIFKRKINFLLKDEQNFNKNAITFKIKPQQGITLDFLGKVPGAKLCTQSFKMDFNYKSLFGEDMIDDYESVILECLYGDHTIFWDKKGVEYSWRILEPLLNKLKKCSLEEKDKMIKFYRPGSYGPEELKYFIKDYRD